METHTQTIKTLTSLAQLDIEASYVYQSVITNITDIIVCNELANFLCEHEFHFRDICHIVGDLGGEIPSYTKDYKSFFTRTYKTLMSKLKKHSALSLAYQNEVLNIKRYEKALKEALFPQARRLVEKGLVDGYRHLAYIKNILENQNQIDSIYIQT